VFPKDFFANLPSLLPITFQIVIIGFLESIAVETNFATKLKYQVTVREREREREKRRERERERERERRRV